MQRRNQGGTGWLILISLALVACAGTPRADVDSKDPSARWRAVHDATPAEVAALARTHQSAEVRALAVVRLDDQVMLQQIARDDIDRDVRRAAINGITDLGALATFAATERDPSLVDFARIVMIQKTSDPAALERIALDDPNPVLRELAVKRLADPALLARIARSDPDRKVRRAALDRVRDGQLLVPLLLELPREEAIEFVRQLTDQDVLRQVWSGHADADVRRAALVKLTDSNLLIDAALNAPDWATREAAVDALRDPAALAHVLLETRNMGIRNRLLQRVRDPQVLAALERKDAERVVERELANRSDTPGTTPARSAERGVLCRSVARSDDREALRQIADENVKREDAYLHAVAALRLLLLESRIRSSIAQPSLECKAALTSRRYGPGSHDVFGESVSIRVLSAGEELAKETWAVKFPYMLTGIPRKPFLVSVDMVNVILKVVDHAQLDESEVRSLLLTSPAADMRRAAIARLSDTALLRRIERTDSGRGVKAAASVRLKALALP